jgi:hypothetical protein
VVSSFCFTLYSLNPLGLGSLVFLMLLGSSVMIEVKFSLSALLQFVMLAGLHAVGSGLSVVLFR